MTHSAPSAESISPSGSAARPPSPPPTFVAPRAPGRVVGWTAPGRVSAVLPGLWGREAIITGDHFVFEDVPAGDVEIHLAVADTPAFAAHALVHVEPGRTSTMQLDLQPATSSVVGTVESATTHQPTGVQAFLLMPDGSPEAWYPVAGGYFGFVGRTPGHRVLLLIARGFKPWRLPVMLEANRELNVGEVALQAVASSATP